ncbi:hypothetical protein HPG69_010366 [Diceros bicornis minor]|uniref:EF-hand domain-containing protein n=1 Tax=Diceros bicornis minor TaxID=77932 RepID=A0A7J7F7K9_DICBM|nr:hypothetical protein HPG69_010366 [Diceros bicornis minor]
MLIFAKTLDTQEMEPVLTVMQAALILFWNELEQCPEQTNKKLKICFNQHKAYETLGNCEDFIDRREIHEVIECLKGMMWTMSGKGPYVLIQNVYMVQYEKKLKRKMHSIIYDANRRGVVNEISLGQCEEKRKIAEDKLNNLRVKLPVLLQKLHLSLGLDQKANQHIDQVYNTFDMNKKSKLQESAFKSVIASRLADKINSQCVVRTQIKRTGTCEKECWVDARKCCHNEAPVEEQGQTTSKQAAWGVCATGMKHKRLANLCRRGLTEVFQGSCPAAYNTASGCLAYKVTAITAAIHKTHLLETNDHLLDCNPLGCSLIKGHSEKQRESDGGTVWGISDDMYNVTKLDIPNIPKRMQLTDGFIDFLEFIAAINLVVRGKVEQKLKWYFKLYDADGNGSIDRKELLNIFMAVQALNGQQTLSPEEFTNLVFHKIDVNNDGELSLKEFISGTENDQDLLEIVSKSFDFSSVLKVICNGKQLDTGGRLPPNRRRRRV